MADIQADGIRQAALPSSGFISGLATASLLFAVFSLAAGLLQSALISALIPEADLAGFLGPETAHPAAPLLGFFLRHRAAAGIFPVAASLTCIAASVGLLGRREWARKIFIGLLGVGIPANLASLALIRSAFVSLPPIPRGIGPAYFGTLITIVEWAAYLGIAATCVLLGWLIRKLSSGPVRSEFF